LKAFLMPLLQIKAWYWSLPSSWNMFPLPLKIRNLRMASAPVRGSFGAKKWVRTCIVHVSRVWSFSFNMEHKLRPSVKGIRWGASQRGDWWVLSGQNISIFLAHHSWVLKKEYCWRIIWATFQKAALCTY
jgi:hypothetical protein